MTSKPKTTERNRRPLEDSVDFLTTAEFRNSVTGKEIGGYVTATRTFMEKLLKDPALATMAHAEDPTRIGSDGKISLLSIMDGREALAELGELSAIIVKDREDVRRKMEVLFDTIVVALEKPEGEASTGKPVTLYGEDGDTFLIDKDGAWWPIHDEETEDTFDMNQIPDEEVRLINQSDVPEQTLDEEGNDSDALPPLEDFDDIDWGDEEGGDPDALPPLEDFDHIDWVDEDDNPF